MRYDDPVFCDFSHNKIIFITDGNKIDDLSKFQYQKVIISLHENPIPDHLKKIINKYNLDHDTERQNLIKKSVSRFDESILNISPVLYGGSFFLFLTGSYWINEKFGGNTLKGIAFISLACPMIYHLLYLFTIKRHKNKVSKEFKVTPKILID